MARIRAITNARVCAHGKEILRDFYVDLATGYIVRKPHKESLSMIDMEHHIVAPAYQELQINGCPGVHFTTFKDSQSYINNLEQVSRYPATTKGISAFYVTLPTVSIDTYRKVLPHLKPRAIAGGADLLGAHCEGPWLNPLKKGAYGNGHAILAFGIY